jgi:phenylpropionate dioxygenase-like ring-hydroxylating dioxygenase large terminal subunit
MRGMETQPTHAGSAAPLANAWYVLCESRELRQRPLSRMLMGEPLVLFRAADNAPAALLDRCPHRNMALSMGRLTGDRLQCAYHGWQFDAAGTCRHIPGLTGKTDLSNRAVTRLPTREQDGYVWGFANPLADVATEPPRFPTIGEGATTVRRMVEAEASLFAVVENALDVPHTAFVHQGLFRGAGRKSLVTARVSGDAHHVQTEYIGEQRPAGLAARILSPTGGALVHHDRFFLPSIVQVEYKLGTDVHFLVTAACTPVEAFRTRLYATVSFRTRFPGWAVRLVLDPVARRIFAQDAALLKQQAASIRRFGGEHFVSTELDLMGPQIQRLVRMAARGGTAEHQDAAWSREVQFEV